MIKILTINTRIYPKKQTKNCNQLYILILFTYIENLNTINNLVLEYYADKNNPI